eukprot:gene12164-16290_t
MAYNLTISGKKNVLTGNWNEESVLHQTTGIRYYPSPKDRKLSLLTKDRCITHSNAEDPKNYQSTLSATYTIPNNHPEFRGRAPRKDEEISLGPRQSRLLATIKQQFEEEFKEKAENDHNESRKINYTSMNQEAFGGTFVNNKNGIKTNYVRTKSSHYSNDNAITFYSHAIQSQSKSNPISFPTTFVGSSANPFRKSAAFSLDIRVPTQVSNRTESNERPRTIPTMKEYKLLDDFRSFLIQSFQKLLSNGESVGLHSNGRAIRAIIQMIWDNASENETKTIEELESSIQNAIHNPAYYFTNDTRSALLAGFTHVFPDPNIFNHNQLSCVTLTNFFRRTVSPKRAELVEYFYNKLDYESQGFIDVTRMIKPYLGTSNVSDELLSFLNIIHCDINNTNAMISMEDFYDFFIDISAEIDDNEVFENQLLNTWYFIEY